MGFFWCCASNAQAPAPGARAAEPADAANRIRVALQLAQAQMVATSDLLLYTSRSLVRLGKAAGYPLTILPVAELVWRRPVGGIVRKEGYLPPAVQRLIDILKSELAARQKRG